VISKRLRFGEARLVQARFSQFQSLAKEVFPTMPTILLFIVAAISAFSQPTPLSLSPSAAPTVLAGTIKGDQSKDYVFQAKKGQRIELNATSARANWLITRVYVKGGTGEDLLNNYITGSLKMAADIPADGEYQVYVGIRRPEARRGGSLSFKLSVQLTGPKSASSAPAEWVQKGACPFECCRYGRWTSQAGAALHEKQDLTSAVVVNIKAGESFKAKTGETHTVAGLFKVNKAFGSFKPGDEVMAYDYMGEGNYRVWVNGSMKQAELLVGPDGSQIGPNGEMVRRPQQTWWVQASAANGKTGWLLVKDIKLFRGADACGN
jgi:hypothetical protein